MVLQEELDHLKVNGRVRQRFVRDSSRKLLDDSCQNGDSCCFSCYKYNSLSDLVSVRGTLPSILHSGSAGSRTRARLLNTSGVRCSGMGRVRLSFSSVVVLGPRSILEITSFALPSGRSILLSTSMVFQIGLRSSQRTLGLCISDAKSHNYAHHCSLNKLH